jgi:hypothetical protein
MTDAPTVSVLNDKSICPKQQWPLNLTKKGLWILPVIWVWAMLLSQHPLTTLQYGGDEHFNLGQTLSFLRGDLPFKDFWTDQPPALPLIFAGLFKIAGTNVGSARIFVLICSGLLIGSVGYLVSLSDTKYPNGILSGLMAQLILISSPMFSLLSISAMQEIPAITFWFCSLSTAITYVRSGKNLAYAAALLFFILALSTKLIVIVYVPLVAVLWVHSLDDSSSRIRRTHIVATEACLLLTVFLLLYASGLNAYLLTPHLDYSNNIVYGLSQHSYRFSFGYLKELGPLVPLLLITIISAVIIKRKPIAIIFAVELSVLFALLASHTPFWDYYLVHIWVASALVAALAVSEMLEMWSRWRPSANFGFLLFRHSAIALTIICTVMFLKPGFDEIVSLRRLPSWKTSEAIKFLNELGAANQSIVSPASMHGVWLSNTLENDFTVMTLKRYWTGNINHESVRGALMKHNIKYLVIPIGAMSTEWSSSVALDYDKKAFEEGVMVFFKTNTTGFHLKL